MMISVFEMCWDRLAHDTIIRQREAGNHWVVEVEAFEDVYPAGLLACELAPVSHGRDVTFTAANMKRYRSTCGGSLFIPGAHLTHIRPTPKEYAADYGRHCPNCGSENIQYDGCTEVDIPSPFNIVKCRSCEAEWNETVQITGYDNLELPT